MIGRLTIDSRTLEKHVVVSVPPGNQLRPLRANHHSTHSPGSHHGLPTCRWWHEQHVKHDSRVGRLGTCHHTVSSSVTCVSVRRLATLLLTSEALGGTCKLWIVRWQSDNIVMVAWLYPRLRGYLEDVRPFIHRLLFFVFFLCVVFQVEISSRTLIPPFSQDQTAVAQRAEMTVAECSLARCVWAHSR